MTRCPPMLQHYRTTEHAIGILASAGDGLVTTKQVAERTGLSQQLVFKIVSRLAKAGLVMSQRGARGGVQLLRPVTEISIAEVVRAVAVGRPNGEGLERDPTFNKALAAFADVLDTYTVADALPGKARATATSVNGRLNPKRKRVASSVRSRESGYAIRAAKPRTTT